MKIYENKLSYDSNEKWFIDLNSIRNNMVRTFHSTAYLDVIRNDQVSKDNDAILNKIIDSFRVEI